MEVKGPIDLVEILETMDDSVRVRVRTFEGEEYELQLAEGECIRAAIPEEEESEESYFSPEILFPNPLRSEPPPALQNEEFNTQKQPAVRRHPLIEELEKLEPTLGGSQCPDCGRPSARLAVSQEGVTAFCRECGWTRRVDVEVLQRLAEALELRCFACGVGTLKSESTEYANILKCQNPDCRGINSWRGVNDRM